MKDNVLIGLSGGVDSAVAAYLLMNNEKNVCGGTLKMFESENTTDIDDAKKIAEFLSIPHYVIDMTKDFSASVMMYFAKAYLDGKTPNPCVFCNKNMKFPGMIKFAEGVGCDYVATGHYAKIRKQGDRYLLLRSEDKKKDQTYMLYLLTQDILSKTIFPLGDMTKEKIREIAEKIKLPVAKKHDSQDICFIKDGDYAGFIENFTHITPKDGDFCDINGKILGKHKGIISYTVGQRKGLGISSVEPYYVISKSAKENKVVLGRNDDLFTKCVNVINDNFIACEKPKASFRATAKIRYSQNDMPCTVFPNENGFTLEFDTDVRAVTPGQSAVVYDGEVVVCGGEIL